MPLSDKNGAIDGLERDLAERGIACVKERFRAPALPQITPSAGYLCGAAGAFLLAAGRPASGFFVSLAGALLLLLGACGFSPLDWLGPKGMHTVLVVPGSITDERRKALFLAIPLRCRLIAGGYFSRGAAARRTVSALGQLLTLLLPILAAAETLLYLSSPPGAAAVAGVALAAMAAAAWVREPAPVARNAAAGWADRWIPPGPGFRPFVLLYSGDVAEVKFFLAKYRRHVLGGHGVFVEFPEGVTGEAAASEREGGYLLPYRVDPALMNVVRDAANECGVPLLSRHALRHESGALVSMARGFAAVTVFRLEEKAAESASFPDNTAIAWIGEIVRRSGTRG